MLRDEPKPTTSLDAEWLTINGAARRLGVTATAIRNRIKRGTLETRPNGNFGRLVRVPIPSPEPVTPTVTLTPPELINLPPPEPATIEAVRAELLALTPPEPVTLTPAEPVTVTPPEPVTLTVTEPMSTLTRHIERLEKALAEANERVSDRDQLAAQVEALKAISAAEKQRSEEWKAVADRFAELSERLVARHAALPWWKKLVG